MSDNSEEYVFSESESEQISLMESCMLCAIDSLHHAFMMLANVQQIRSGFQRDTPLDECYEGLVSAVQPIKVRLFNLQETLNVKVTEVYFPDAADR